MLHGDLTLSTPEENLACDEALLDLSEENGSIEILRFWEPSREFVVVGYANRVAAEVNLDFCRKRGIPILRRCSGGGTVLQGPGCLDYSLILSIEARADVHSISATNQFILNRHQQALSALLNRPVEAQGHTDLAIGGLKFSGNAQRRRKRSLLFHGTFLLNLDIEQIEAALLMPSQEPQYRDHRPHREFLTNLHVPASRIKEALRKTWEADKPLSEIPLDGVAELARTKYHLDSWNLKF